jgi:hypothetical protein
VPKINQQRKEETQTTTTTTSGVTVDKDSNKHRLIKLEDK